MGQGDLCGGKGPLRFSSDFESGNLSQAHLIWEHEYDLRLLEDHNTCGHTQWYYFQVRNMEAGVPYRFNVVNLGKSDSLYNDGMLPVLYSEKQATSRGIGWQRQGRDVRYYKGIPNPSQRGSYWASFTIEFPEEDDVAYLAMAVPYTLTDLRKDLVSWTSTEGGRASICRREVLCKSLGGLDMDLLTISEGVNSPDHDEAVGITGGLRKPVIALSARVHPGETNASWMMKGAVEYLLSDTDEARELRARYTFKILPMLNPDGVVLGNYRCSLAGLDLNRQCKPGPP